MSMELQQQVTSIELSKKLKELGIKQESLWYWTKIQISLNKKIMESESFDLSCKENYPHIGYDSIYLTGCSECNYGDKISEIYSTFTASELLELLPISIGNWDLEIYKFKIGYSIDYLYNTWNKPPSCDSILANAVAKMLIYLIENKLLEIK